ncbi:MAG: hypothetical protein Q8M77_03120 [Hydrogenophaga sp.]|nr:hypothetical protein [Hydrogenophaga sp.]
MKLNRGEPDHPHWKRPFTPKEMAVTWWGFGACSLVLGLREWFEPSQSPFSGRWSWLNTIAFNAMGQRGPAYLYMGLGAIVVFAGCLKWYEHRTQKRA